LARQQDIIDESTVFHRPPQHACRRWAQHPITLTETERIYAQDCKASTRESSGKFDVLAMRSNMVL